MFYSIKKTIITRSLKKRNIENPFQYEAAEQFHIKEDDSDLINNSYYFSAHNQEMSFYCRLGQRSCHDEVWVCLFYKGKQYRLSNELFQFKQSPLVLKQDKDNYRLSFKGILNENDNFEIEADFTSLHKAIDFTTDMPEERMAVAVSNEKWNKDFFNSLKSISGQTHYEQEGCLKGYFTLNGEKVDINLPCIRDHSFGKRDWTYMNNHLWLMAINENKQFNYSLVSYLALTCLEVGNLREDKQHYLLKADLDLSLISQNKVPDTLSFKARFDHKMVDVSATVLASTCYTFADEGYFLHECIAQFQIGQETYRGILEIGFNKDTKRIFNGKKVLSIKRK